MRSGRNVGPPDVDKCWVRLANFLNEPHYLKPERSSWLRTGRPILNGFDWFCAFHGSTCPNYVDGKPATSFTQLLRYQECHGKAHIFVEALDWVSAVITASDLKRKSYILRHHGCQWRQAKAWRNHWQRKD